MNPLPCWSGWKTIRQESRCNRSVYRIGRFDMRCCCLPWLYNLDIQSLRDATNRVSHSQTTSISSTKIPLILVLSGHNWMQINSNEITQWSKRVSFWAVFRDKALGHLIDVIILGRTGPHEWYFLRFCLKIAVSHWYISICPHVMKRKVCEIRGKILKIMNFTGKKRPKTRLQWWMTEKIHKKSLYKRI